MNTDSVIHKALKKYAAWYKVVRGGKLLQMLVFGLMAALGLVYLFDKLIFLGIDRSTMAAYGAGAVALALLAFLLFAPKRMKDVSYLIDQKAGLKNLVGSGLDVSGDDEEICQIVTNRAREALTKQKPQELLPLKLHWTGRYLYIPLVVLLTALFIPRMDVLGRKQAQDKIVQEKKSVEEGAIKLTEKMAQITKSDAEAQSIEGQDIINDFTALSEELKGAAKDDALLKLGEFENKYKENFSDARDFEQAAKTLKANPDFKGMSEESKEELEKLIKNLKDGNFADAADAMKKLAEQMGDDAMSAEQKKALARELEKVAKQMQEKGMSGDLAKALQELQASEKDLQEMMKECQSQMGEMAQQCQAAQQLQAMKEGLASAKQSMLGDSFKDFNAQDVEAMMDQEASLGMKECSSCSGLGCGSCDGTGMANSTAMGQGKGKGGTGGEGQGRGGNPPEEATDTAFKESLTNNKVNKGRILHQMFIQGVPEKGESRSEYIEVIQDAKQHAAGSLARERIPKEYEDLVKSYFDSLDQEGEAGSEP